MWIKIPTFMKIAVSMKTRALSFLMVCLISLGSCSKIVEEKQKDLLISVMTRGQWHVEEFLEGTTPVTDDFNGYNFQFEADGSVIGEKGDSKIPGKWVGDIANYSISSTFPSSSAPLVKLNGVWKILKTELDFVEAEMANGATKNRLRLRKNS
jgi:hypothetical protein